MDKHTLEGIPYEVSFSHSINGIEELWDSHSGHSIFLKSAFYKGLEASPPSSTSYRYAIVWKGSEVVAALYFQLKKIKLHKSLRLDAVKAQGFGPKLLLGVKKVLARQIQYYTLVHGNMTLTGNYGYHYNDTVKTDHWKISTQVAELLVKHLKKEGIKVRGILHKDFSQEARLKEKPADYSEFSVQPNMILYIPSEWQSFDDYLGAMKSKYKVRVRRALKKKANLEKRLLSLKEIKSYEADISRLYYNVVNGAGFNLFFLPDDYFYSLQKHLGEKMKITAYFDGDLMVGFYTSIANHHEFDAHFLGYDPTCNGECQLYLNMLYDLVDEAIANKSEALVLSRTAMEIKSSVGAVGQPMYLYMKATNGLINKILGRALNYFTPETKWKPRSPFK